MDYETLLEYTYGLCNLTPSDLDMDLNEFLEFLYARYMYREHERDNNLQWYSWFTANIMLSSGNYKKNTKARRLNESIYIPLDDRIKKAQEEHYKKTKEYQEEQKEKLEKIFGIKMGEGD